METDNRDTESAARCNKRRKLMLTLDEQDIRAFFPARAFPLFEVDIAPSVSPECHSSSFKIALYPRVSANGHAYTRGREKSWREIPLSLRISP